MKICVLLKIRMIKREKQIDMIFKWFIISTSESKPQGKLNISRIQC